MRNGKSKFPIIAPDRPNIIASETFIVLVDVGNMETTEAINVVAAISATEIYPADNKSVIRAFPAQYNAIPQDPEIRRHETEKRKKMSFQSFFELEISFLL